LMPWHEVAAVRKSIAVNHFRPRKIPTGEAELA